MHFVDISSLLATVRSLGAISSLCEFEQGGQADDQFKTTFQGKLKAYVEPITRLELTASVASLQKLIRLLNKESPSFKDIGFVCAELHERLIDETNSREFFSLTLRESAFYARPREGWEVSIERFPNVIDDVEEASKCYALSRYAAAVFHSLQVVEIGLIKLGEIIGVNDPLAGWTSTTNALKKIIDAKYPARTPFQQKHSAFLEQIYGTTESLKSAWRNKISHAHGKLTLMTSEFSPEVAEEILFATRAFMRRLATDGPLASSEGKPS